MPSGRVTSPSSSLSMPSPARASSAATGGHLRRSRSRRSSWAAGRCRRRSGRGCGPLRRSPDRRSLRSPRRTACPPAPARSPRPVRHRHPRRCPLRHRRRCPGRRRRRGRPWRPRSGCRWGRRRPGRTPSSAPAAPRRPPRVRRSARRSSSSIPDRHEGVGAPCWAAARHWVRTGQPVVFNRSRVFFRSATGARRLVQVYGPRRGPVRRRQTPGEAVSLLRGNHRVLGRGTVRQAS